MENEDNGVAKKNRILIVDDEPLNVALLEGCLQSEGYEIFTASDGFEALEIIEKRDVDLILLDVMMPKLDGFEVTRQIREKERARLIPVILITALEGTSDRIKGIEAGCDDFISKPYNVDEVVARCRNLIKMNYYRCVLDEKEKFEYVMNHVDDGVIVCDADLRIMRINEAAKNLIGAPEECTGIFIDKFLTALFNMREPDRIKRQLPQESIFLELERPETENVRPLILSLRSSVVRNPLGEVTSIVLFIRDITAQKKKEFAENSFISTISHKLFTPMTIIQSSLELFQEGVLGELSGEQKDNVSRALEKSKEFSSSLEKLVGYAALKTKKLETAKEDIKLLGYFDEILKEINHCMDKQFKLNIRGVTDQSILKAHRAYFDLIVKNLLENAFVFNENEVVEIDMAVQQSDNDVEITISDNGIGIPSEEKERIFESFYQVDKYRSGTQRGSGIGLAIVKHLVTAMGGTIDVNSRLEGSSFSFRIPREVRSFREAA